MFLDDLCNTQMLSIKYACSMKKMMMMIKNKNKKKKIIVINNKKEEFRIREKKNLEGEKN